MKSSEDECLGFIFSSFAYICKKCINELSGLKCVYHVNPTEYTEGTWTSGKF